MFQNNAELENTWMFEVAVLGSTCTCRENSSWCNKKVTSLSILFFLILWVLNIVCLKYWRKVRTAEPVNAPLPRQYCTQCTLKGDNQSLLWYLLFFYIWIYPSLDFVSSFQMPYDTLKRYNESQPWLSSFSPRNCYLTLKVLHIFKTTLK